MSVKLAYLLIDGFALMSYAPVIEPFRAANMLSGTQLYEWRHYSVGGGPAFASNGVPLGVDGAIASMTTADIVLVCAGGNPTLFRDPTTLAALRRAARFGAVIVGVSGGPFILARAGLLDGFRCTIHWEHEQAFIETFASPLLGRNLFEIDGKRITCAGGIAGLDLATTLIAAEHGQRLARRINDWYIHSEHRPTGDLQRQAPAVRYGVSHPGLLSVIDKMDASVAAPLARHDLADLAGLSVRQLERLFRAHLDVTIGEHHLRLRLDQARKLVDETDMSITSVSATCGFSTSSQFSRAFKRQFAISPSKARRARSATKDVIPDSLMRK